MMDLPTIGVVGEHKPTYHSHVAIDSAIARLPIKVAREWIPTSQLTEGAARRLARIDGLFVAPGDYEHPDGALAAIEFARETHLPLTGTWGGFQRVLVEYARNVARIPEAGHEEDDPHAETLVVTRLACSLKGEARSVRPVPGTKAASICGTEAFIGHHSCSFGLNPELLPKLEGAGLVVSGYNEDGTVEIVELPDHPYFIATLFQPEESGNGVPGSAPLHPLLLSFANAVADHHRQRMSERGPSPSWRPSRDKPVVCRPLTISFGGWGKPVCHRRLVGLSGRVDTANNLTQLARGEVEENTGVRVTGW
jgi:CTP synthase (UTP-ammonia lyase)